MRWGSQWVYCQGCGRPFETSFSEYDGRVCSPECWTIFEQTRAKVITSKRHTGPTPLDHMREELAALEHVQWAQRTRYMIGVLGSKALIVARMPEANHWLSLCETPYSQLPEEEKDPNREKAERVLQILGCVPL